MVQNNDHFITLMNDVGQEIRDNLVVTPLLCNVWGLGCEQSISWGLELFLVSVGNDFRKLGFLTRVVPCRFSTGLGSMAAGFWGAACGQHEVTDSRSSMRAFSGLVLAFWQQHPIWTGKGLDLHRNGRIQEHVGRNVLFRLTHSSCWSTTAAVEQGRSQRSR